MLTETELRGKLQQTYNPKIWQEIFSAIFTKIEYLSTPLVLVTNSNSTKSVRQIGKINISDGTIGLFIVEVDDTVIISRNRVKLREIAATYIDQDIINGAFVFYYSKKQADYRFTFITKKSGFQ